MHIMHIAGGGDIGGAKTHVISLLAALKERHDVVLVSLRQGPFSDDAIAAGIPTASPAAAGVDKETVSEAVSALSMLGFPTAAANKVVQSIAKEQPGATVEQLIKLALKQL